MVRGKVLRQVLAMMVVACVGLLGAVAAQAPLASVALAQESSDPPELGAPVVQDALIGTGPFRPRTCTTGLNASEHIEDGFRVSVTGRCSENATSALLASTAIGLTAVNGDISIEMRTIEGYERAWVGIAFREQSNGDGYFLSWTPSRGQVRLAKSIGSITATVAENGSVEPTPADTWTRFSVRFSGQRIWAFVNDELVITVTDPSLSRGGLTIVTGRLGTLNEEGTVAVVWRNLRVSALAREAPPTTTSATANSGAARPPGSAAAPTSGAPSGTPPEAGEVVHEASLAERGIIPTGMCPTGKGRGEVVGEGFLMAVRGKCTECSRNATVGPSLPGLTVPDGEIRVELKVTNGHDRAVIVVVSRLASGSPNSYALGISPGLGVATIVRVQQDGQSAVLARRADVGGQFSRDDWNTLAVRQIGSSLCLLVNDQPVLAADDGTYGSGGVALGVSKLGDADDDQEVAVVFRNLSVAASEGAPDDRAPTYVRPNGPPGSGSVLGLMPFAR